MKLSTETYVMQNRFDDKTAIKMIRDAGYDHFDYSMYWTTEQNYMLGEDYRERAEDLRRYADGLGITCNQAHAPFVFRYKNAMELSDPVYQELIRSLEVASILGAETVIVHAVCELPEEVDFYEYNRKYYQSLIPYCEKFGIEVSVENLFTFHDGTLSGILSDPKDHIAFVKSLGADCFNICVDLGHSAITGRAPEDVIAAMDSRLLKSLHVHDNNLKSDQHIVPLFGSMDYQKIMSALKAIGYSGDLTFEIFGFLGKLDNELLAPALSFAEKIGRNLIAK